MGHRNLWLSTGILFLGNRVVKDLFASIWELLFLTNTGIVGYSPNDASYLSNDATWYISAMILSMLLLWPLLRKYKENFFYIIAPLMICFLLGYSYQKFPSLRRPMKWQGVVLAFYDKGNHGNLHGMIFPF